MEASHILVFALIHLAQHAIPSAEPLQLEGRKLAAMERTIVSLCSCEITNAIFLCASGRLRCMPIELWHLRII